MESGGDWCLIESDPGVFTTLIKKFGVKGVQVEELWSMDDNVIEKLKPVHGLIFLFKFLQNAEPELPVVTDKEQLEKIYFAKQVINNACATQAVISLLLNCNHPDVRIGPELTKLKEFSMTFDPNMRGLALSNSDTIRIAHNSMAPCQLFEFDTKTASKDEDVHHFVGYMPIDGRLYELNGLREGPIDHGPIGRNQDWLHVVRPTIMKRINAYTEGEIHFNLMALVDDQRMLLERQLHELHCGSGILTMDSDSFERESRRLTTLMEQENLKLLRYRQELSRRRHNYVPFIINQLKILARAKKLTPMLEKAKERAGERVAARKLKVLHKVTAGTSRVEPEESLHRLSQSSPSRLVNQENMQCSLGDLDSIFTEPHDLQEIQEQPQPIQYTPLPQQSKKSQKSHARHSTQSQQSHHTRKSHQSQATQSSFRQPLPPRQTRQSAAQSPFRQPLPPKQFEFRQPLPRPQHRQSQSSSPFRQPLPTSQFRQAYALQQMQQSVPLSYIQQAHHSRPIQQPHSSTQTQEQQYTRQLQPQPHHSADILQSLQQPSCSTSNINLVQPHTSSTQIEECITEPVQNTVDLDDDSDIKFLNADEIFKGTVFDHLNSFDGEAIDPFLEDMDDITAPSMPDHTTMTWETSSLFGDNDPNDQQNVP